MPELPEVEVLRRSLEPRLVGETIEGVTVRVPALREPIPKARLARDVTGRQVVGLRRRAKYLLIDLAGGITLVLHLGMSGRLTLVPGETPPEAHEHVVFHLASGRRLRFRDPRRFGQIFSLPGEEIAGHRRFAHLGIEPFDPAFTGDCLRRSALGRRGPVKAFLMDASVVVGVGNIYASEVLFQTRIHPRRSVARISRQRWEAVAEAVRTVLGEAIAEGGTTLNDFTDGEGNRGYFQVSLAAYGREGEACHRCGEGGSIRRIVQAGRSTFYCPRCQH